MRHASWRVVSCHFTPFNPIPCHDIPGHRWLCYNLKCNDMVSMLCCTVSCVVLSLGTLLFTYAMIWHVVVLCNAMSCHIRLLCIMLYCHTMPCHAMPRQVTFRVSAISGRTSNFQCKRTKQHIKASLSELSCVLCLCLTRQSHNAAYSYAVLPRSRALAAAAGTPSEARPCHST